MNQPVFVYTVQWKVIYFKFFLLSNHNSHDKVTLQLLLE